MVISQFCVITAHISAERHLSKISYENFNLPWPLLTFKTIIIFHVKSFFTSAQGPTVKLTFRLFKRINFSRRLGYFDFRQINLQIHCDRRPSGRWYFSMWHFSGSVHTIKIMISVSDISGIILLSDILKFARICKHSREICLKQR